MLDRWELHSRAIGEVTETGELRAFCRRRDRRRDPGRVPHRRVPALRGRAASRDSRRPRGRGRSRCEPRADKAWIYEQYDQLVGSRTVRRPGLDAAVLRLRPSLRGLAVSLARPAARRARPVRSRACRPCSTRRATSPAPAASRSALTDCLNFGNPEKPEIGWELAEAIEGIAQAAEALGIPVVSGNVSLYNETDGRAIPPTPVVGCVGLVPDVRRGARRGWQPGDVVLLAQAPSRASRPRPR